MTKVVSCIHKRLPVDGAQVCTKYRMPPLSRTVWSSNKGKGNELEVAQPLIISENEFELVMGLFEKITHEKTEFFHHVCRAIDFILIVG